MRNKKSVGVTLLLLVIIFTSIYVVRKKQMAAKKPKEPTIADIMDARAKNSEKQLETPLGRAITSRNWAEVDKLYHPDKDFLLLAEVIRGEFINEKMKENKPEDQEKLMALVLSTFDTIPEKTYHMAGLLESQLFRLPTPKHDSANFALLKKWALDERAPAYQRKMALVKLVIHDSNPIPEAVAVYQKNMLKKDSFGDTEGRWVQQVADVRNQQVLISLTTTLNKNFTKLPTDAQAPALNVLAHSIQVKPEDTKKFAFQFLKTTDQGKFESALRAFLPLINANILTVADKDELVKKLTNLPVAVKTPFVNMKSQEILTLIHHA